MSGNELMDTLLGIIMPNLSERDQKRLKQCVTCARDIEACQFEEEDETGMCTKWIDRDSPYDSMVTFLKALNEAEGKDQREYSCPLCGGTVRWTKSEYNGHIFAKCDKCGIVVRE